MPNNSFMGYQSLDKLFIVMLYIFFYFFKIVHVYAKDRDTWRELGVSNTYVKIMSKTHRIYISFYIHNCVFITQLCI